MVTKLVIHKLRFANWVFQGSDDGWPTVVVGSWSIGERGSRSGSRQRLLMGLVV